MERIKIDFVSDVVCPWCAIGYKRLERAIAETGLQDKVDIVWHPFFLNPDMPEEGENNEHYGARKYQRTAEESRLNRQRITELAREAGFDFNLDENTRVFNTRNAHTLLEYAKNTGKQTELKARLFEAFFTEQKNISDKAVLEKELQAIGLDTQNLEDVFNDPQIQKHIDAEVAQWQKLGISSVPTMIVNEKTAVNGSQSVEGYKQMLTDTLEQ